MTQTPGTSSRSPAFVDSLRRGADHLNPISIWGRAIERKVSGPPVRYDAGFMAKLLPFMERFARYFDAEVRGLERLPATGPVMLVGNHSGGIFTPDTSALYVAWYRERGLDEPLMGMAFDGAFSWPGIGHVMPKIGQMPASQQNALTAFDQGASLLVYPGGAHEVFRPWSQRDQVDLTGRKGFIRLALRAGVPVVPVVGHGGHHSTVVLSRGDRLAKVLGMNRIRFDVFPILLQIPWGVSFPGLPALPLPAKITMEALPAMDWTHLGPEDAEDPEVIEACYREISGLMQETMDRLASEHPRPIRARVRRLLGREPKRAPATRRAAQC